LKIDAQTGKLTQVSDGFVKLDKRVTSAKSAMGGVSSHISSIVKAAAGMYIVKQAFDAATYASKQFIDTAAQFEQYETTLKTITGSSQKAKESMDWIGNFASQTPFYIEKMTESFVKLKSYGIEPTDGTLRTLGDTASAMGKDVMQAVEAMADAITGENERLKEFGIKARVQGDKIAYTWADSSGKSKNIVIQNNREIIQNTLEAIMNEKYSGAMAEQAKTWNGMVSNIQDQWTLFKKDVMDEGLFDYLKAMAGVVGDYLSAAFGDAKNGAASFSKSIISGIESSVSAVGVLSDTFSLFGGVFDFLKTAFWQMVGALGTGMNSIQTAWNSLGNAMSKLWANMANGVKEIFQGVINYIIDKVNYVSDSVNDAATAVGLDPILGKLEHVSFEKTKAEISKISEPISNVETAWKYAEDARKSYEKNFKAFWHGAGQQKAKDAIDDIKKKLSEITKVEGSNIEAHKKYAEELEKLGAKDGDFKGFEKAAKKSLKGYEDKAKAVSQNVNTWLKDAFNIDSGVIGEKLFDGLWDSLQNFASAFKSDDPFAVNNAYGELLTAELDAVYPGAGTSLKTIGAMFSQTLSDAEIAAAAGRSDFDNKSLDGLKSLYEKYSAPQLTVAEEQLDRLRSMDEKFGAIAISLGNTTIGGMKLDGSDFTPDTSSVLGGIISASSTELLGAGIKFGEQTVDAFIEGVNAVGYQTVKKTTSFHGIFSKEKVKESTTELSDQIRGDLQSVMQDAIDIAADNLEILGFDKTAFEEAVNSQILDLGKINFKDLDAEEKADVLESAIGEAIDGAVNGALSAMDSQQLVQQLDEMRIAGESVTDTIGRVAVGFESVEAQLAFFGQSVESFGQSQALIDAAGGLDKWNSSMKTFMNSFFSDGEQQAFLQQQLQYSLAVYDVALPASKEQFKALVLETQEKILSTKATIDTLKAEIAAKVAAGEMSIQAAYGELDAKGQIANAQNEVTKYQINSNNALISSAHNAGQAAVGFGASVHNSIQAMATGVANAVVAGTEQSVDSAGNIDYSRITSPAIQAAEASLSELEGLYGTLMQNMGGFSDYYGGVESAADGAATALNDLEERLLSIANIRAEWKGDGVESAQIVLDAVIRNTGIKDVTYENFLDKFNAVVNESTPKDVIDDWKALGDALRKLHDAQQASIRGFEDIEMMWSGADALESVQLTLNRVVEDTGLIGVNYDNFIEKMKEAQISGDDVQKWKDLSEALRAVNDAVKTNTRGFEDIGVIWNGASELESAQVALNRVVKDTGLVGVNYDNFLEKMRQAQISGDDVKKWQDLSEALRAVHDASEKMAEDEKNRLKDMAKGLYDLTKSARDAVLEFGEQSIEVSMMSLNDYINNADYDGAKKAFDEIANNIKDDGSLTYKDKVFSLARANNQIQGIEKKDPNADIVKGLELLREENEKLREEQRISNERLKEIERNTYVTKNNTDDEYRKIVGLRT